MTELAGNNHVIFSCFPIISLKWEQLEALRIMQTVIFLFPFFHTFMFQGNNEVRPGLLRSRYCQKSVKTNKPPIPKIWNVLPCFSVLLFVSNRDHYTLRSKSATEPQFCLIYLSPEGLILVLRTRKQHEIPST